MAVIQTPTTLQGHLDLFQAKLNDVDPTKTITGEIDGTYGPFEWSFNALHVKGGSNLAVSYGAAELFEQLGYRFFGTAPWQQILPSVIRTDLSAAKQEYWIPNPAVFLGSGQSWSGSYAASLELLINRWTYWRYLNGVGLTAFPAGASWLAIKNKQPAWFAARPQMIKAGRIATFDLENLSPGDYAELVELCAAVLLHYTDIGLNEWKRASIEADDSNPSNSDTIFEFAKAVAIKVRAGTNAIGTIPQKTGVPEAVLGCYAYSNHDLPPTNSVAPYVYTQIAFAYNGTNYTFKQLIELHGAKAANVSIREYYDDNNFSHSEPWGQVCSLSDYWDKYTDYRAGGVRAVNGQFSVNWLTNLVGMRQFVKKVRTGSYTYEQALSDVVDGIFGGDPKVKELYRLWSDRFVGHNRWSLRRAFDIVNDMQEGTYKRHFQNYLVILYEQMFLPPQLSIAAQTPADPFPAAMSKLCNMIIAVRDDEIIHSYALLTQDYNGDVRDNYPALYFEKNPPPTWVTNTPVLPQVSEFTTYRTALQTSAARSSVYDNNDLVLIQGLTPSFNPASANPVLAAFGNPSTFYFTHGQPVFAFVGPGTIRHEQRTSNNGVISGARVLTADYGPGLHFHYPEDAGYWLTTWTGGMLFLKAFPRVRRDNGATPFQYLYNPTRGANKFALEAESNVRLYTAGAWGTGTVRNLNPSVSAATIASWVPTGQITIEGGNTSGFWNLIEGNPYLSPYPSIALVPRQIAEEDKAAGIKLNYVSV